MKVAHQVCGHLRTFRENTTIVPNLLEAVPGDVFVSTFAVRNFAGNKWHLDEGGAGDVVTDDDVAWIKSNWPNVVDVWVSPLASGGEGMPPDLAAMGFRKARALGCDLRRMHRLTLSKMWQDYDVVIVSRPDLGLRQPLALPDIIAPNTLYGGYNANQERQGCDGEVFVYGRPEVIDAAFLPAIPGGFSGLASELGYHGEKLSTEIRKAAGLAYAPHRIPHFLYRSGGAITEIEQ